MIDTQAILDRYFFDDPVCNGWDAAWSSRSWRWIATVAMRDELAHVLGRGFGSRWSGDPTAPLTAFDRLATMLPTPELPTATKLRCSDPDDQKFIDLAIAAGAHTLVTRDRALLKLGRRAHERHGLRVLRSADWLA